MLYPPFHPSHGRHWKKRERDWKLCFVSHTGYCACVCLEYLTLCIIIHDHHLLIDVELEQNISCLKKKLSCSSYIHCIHTYIHCVVSLFLPLLYIIFILTIYIKSHHRYNFPPPLTPHHTHPFSLTLRGLVTSLLLTLPKRRKIERQESS